MKVNYIVQELTTNIYQVVERKVRQGKKIYNQEPPPHEMVVFNGNLSDCCSYIILKEKGCI